MCNECWGTDGDERDEPFEEIEPDTEPPFGTSWTRLALTLLGDTLGSKRSDYSTGDEFGNFEGAADVASIKVEDVMLAQVGIKLGRIKNLRDSEDTPHYEPLLDSYRDLAGYAILAYAHALKWTEGGGNEKGIYRKKL